MKSLGLICLFATLAAGTTSVETKLHALQFGGYPLGSRIPFNNTEINDYVQWAIPTYIGPGVRNARVEVDAGGIVRGNADIDFLKLRQAEGENPGWLMSQLLSGERPVAITVKITSGQGKIRVDVQRVAVSGMVAEGRTLEVLINNFVVPTFPDIKVGKDFPLDYRIDRLDFRPGLATVVLKTNRYN